MALGILIKIVECLGFRFRASTNMRVWRNYVGVMYRSINQEITITHGYIWQNLTT